MWDEEVQKVRMRMACDIFSLLELDLTESQGGTMSNKRDHGRKDDVAQLGFEHRFTVENSAWMRVVG